MQHHNRKFVILTHHNIIIVYFYAFCIAKLFTKIPSSEILSTPLMHSYFRLFVKLIATCVNWPDDSMSVISPHGLDSRMVNCHHKHDFISGEGAQNWSKKSTIFSLKSAPKCILLHEIPLKCSGPTGEEDILPPSAFMAPRLRALGAILTLWCRSLGVVPHYFFLIRPLICMSVTSRSSIKTFEKNRAAWFWHGCHPWLILYFISRE